MLINLKKEPYIWGHAQTTFVKMEIVYPIFLEMYQILLVKKRLFESN